MLCENAKICGITYDGGYQEYMVAEQEAVALIPDDLKSAEELVEEGAQRACKDLMVNRAKDLDDLGIKIDIKIAVNLIKNKFPYNKLPKNKTKARSFYTATICNLVAESVLDMV